MVRFRALPALFAVALIAVLLTPPTPATAAPLPQGVTIEWELTGGDEAIRGEKFVISALNGLDPGQPVQAIACGHPIVAEGGTLPADYTKDCIPYPGGPVLAGMATPWPSEWSPYHSYIAVVDTVAPSSFGVSNWLFVLGPPPSVTYVGKPTPEKPVVGDEVLRATVNYSTTTPVTQTFQWFRCPPISVPCIEIAGATSGTYTATAADLDHTLVVQVKLTNATGSVVVQSLATDPVGLPAPTLVEPPQIYGAGVTGEKLSATSGVWTGHPSFVFQWQVQDGATWKDIPGANLLTYTVPETLLGQRVRVHVTATYGGPSATASSDSLLIDYGIPVVGSPSPTVGGVARVGETLELSIGTWNHGPDTTINIQWHRCTFTCSPISGATAPLYHVTGADVGAMLRVAVTATNAYGTTTAFTALTEPVRSAAPTNTVAPQVPGPLLAGLVTTGAVGAWDGAEPVDYTFQWQYRPDGGSWEDVADATSADIVPSQQWVSAGHVRLAVTATNWAGSATAYSDAYQVEPGVAHPVTKPAVTGSLMDGHQLTAAPGTWQAAAPSTKTTSWLRCSDVDSCETIDGATSGSYTVSSADVGHHIVVVETVTNAHGSTTSKSAPSEKIVAAPPAMVTAPQVAGSSVGGGQLTATPGTWTGTGPLSMSYRWQMYHEHGWAYVAGADSATWNLPAHLAGALVRVEVTATNSAGKAAATSLSTIVKAGAPYNTVPPSLSGDTVDGETLTLDVGEWTAAAPYTTTVQWERCVIDGGCTPVADSDGSTFVLSADDIGFELRASVTITNTYGSATKFTPRTMPVTAEPLDGPPPTVSGTPRVGSVLEATMGTWSGSGDVTVTWQWQRCDADATACEPIADATASEYTVKPGDVGTALRAVATVSSGWQTLDVPSAATVPVPTPPSGTAGSGATSDGSTVTVSGVGFQPGSTVELSLMPWPSATSGWLSGSAAVPAVLLGEAVVDGNGTFKATFVVPAEFPPGRATVRVVGLDPFGDPAIIDIDVKIEPVLPPPAPPADPEGAPLPDRNRRHDRLPYTGSASSTLLVFAALAFATGGLLRRRALRHSRR